MEHRFLGRSGLKVSAIAYGNWLTHGSQIDDDTATAAVHEALEQGITTFDTADAYAGTRAEAVLGAALDGQRREGLEICTKVYFRTGEGANDSGLSRKHVIESCDASLRRLRTDHIDLYQAHRFDHETPLEETMLAFADLVRSGKILYVGVSEWNAEQIAAGAALARDLQVPLISNQPQYSLLWRVIEAEVVPASRDAGLGQIVWSPLAQGVLTGKYRPGEPAPENSRANDEAGGAEFVRRWLRHGVLRRIQEAVPLVEAAGLTMAQYAVAWVLRNPDVGAAIVGASRPEQLVENVRAAEVVLDDDLVAAVDAVLDPVVERDPSRTASPPTRP